MSSKARLVITAIEVEGRSPAKVCTAYGVSRSWRYELLARHRAEGDAAFEPRSKRPHASPQATPPATAELVLRLRKQLTEAGLDAGADTIGRHLTHSHRTTVSRATIHRILTRAGTVTPQPATRPKASYRRFARLALHVTAHPRITGPIVLATFRHACALTRIPVLHAH